MNKNMDAKVVGVELYSKGWGVTDFLNEYGLSDVDELKACLFKVVPDTGKVGKMVRMMKKNDKKKCKKADKNQKEQLDSETTENKSTEYVSAKTDTMTTPIPYNPQANYTEVIKSVESQLATVENPMDETEKQMPTRVNSVGAQLLKNIKVDPIKMVAVETAQVVDASETADESEEVTEVNVADDNSETNTVVETDTKPEEVANTPETTNNVNDYDSDEKLITLNNRLSTINEKIIDSEIKIKEFHSRKRALSISIDEIVVTLKSLEDQLLIQKQKFDDAYTESVLIDEGVAAEKQVLKGLQSTKDDIMSQIRELMAITLYCGSNDQEIEKSFDYMLADFDIDNTDVTAKFKEFFERDDEKFDEFSVSDLKKVAKIILAEEKIKGETDSKVELYFDSENNLTSIFKLMERKVIILGD